MANKKLRFKDLRDDTLYEGDELLLELLKNDYYEILEINFGEYSNNFIDDFFNTVHPKYLKNEDVLYDAVLTNPKAILYIEEPSEKIQYLVVKDDPNKVAFFSNPTKKIQNYVFEEHPPALQYVEYLGGEIQLKLISKDLKNIEYINNPSKKIQHIILEKDLSLLSAIKNPLPEITKVKDDYFKSISSLESSDDWF